MAFRPGPGESSNVIKAGSDDPILSSARVMGTGLQEETQTIRDVTHERMPPTSSPLVPNVHPAFPKGGPAGLHVPGGIHYKPRDKFPRNWPLSSEELPNEALPIPLTVSGNDLPYTPHVRGSGDVFSLHEPVDGEDGTIEDAIDSWRPATPPSARLLPNVHPAIEKGAPAGPRASSDDHDRFWTRFMQTLRSSEEDFNEASSVSRPISPPTVLRNDPPFYPETPHASSGDHDFSLFEPVEGEMRGPPDDDMSRYLLSKTVSYFPAAHDLAQTSPTPPPNTWKMDSTEDSSNWLEWPNRSTSVPEEKTLTPNTFISAASTPANSNDEQLGRHFQMLSTPSGNESVPIPRLQMPTPHVDKSYLSLICSNLLIKLSRIRGFNFYFSLLSSPEEKGDFPSDPTSRVRDLFSLGIPLCYIFDLLPAEEGFARINLSQFNAEEFSVNPTREKNHAISLFLMQLFSEKVRQTIPGCVPFLITDISGPPHDLIKAVITVDAIVSRLPSHVLSAPEPPNLFSDRYGLRSLARCRTADAALNHARMAEHLISDALARSGLDGLYYIQVGLNEELIARGQGTLEEIYIYTDSEFQGDHVAAISPALAQLSQVLSPFPGVLYTPENTYHISPHVHSGEELSESELWCKLKQTGVFHKGLGFPKITVRGGRSESQATPSGNGAPAPHPQRQSNGANRKGKGRAVSDEDPDEDGFEGDRGYNGGGGGGGGTPTGPGGLRADRGPKNLSIPFHAKLVIKDDKHKVSSRFTTSANVNMKLAEDTSDGKTKVPSIDPDPRPDGWFGPWFSIQLPFIQTNSSDVVSGYVHYNVSMAQVRIAASSCLSSFLSFSPGDSYSVEDPVKAKQERNYTGGGWATLSGTPSVKVGGTTSQISGTETSHKKWEITVSPSSDNKTEKSITWKYTLNDKYYSAQSTATFQPGPSVNFGYKLHARRPRVEVELVMCWSITPNNARPRLRHWFSNYRFKENPQSPSAFTNFLHQISVSVDLENLNANAWVVGLNPDLPDEESLPDFHGLRQFKSTQVNADSVSSNLNCEVTLHRALHGRIQLSKHDKTSDKSLLPSLSGSSASTAPPQQTIPPLLPTPPRSPPRVHM